jgi:hypothetical protein
LGKEIPKVRENRGKRNEKEKEKEAEKVMVFD